jgi:hypothetical protein
MDKKVTTFGEIKVGDKFKMSKDSRLVYKKINNTDAKCSRRRHFIQLGDDQLIVLHDD